MMKSVNIEFFPQFGGFLFFKFFMKGVWKTSKGFFSKWLKIVSLEYSAFWLQCSAVQVTVCIWTHSLVVYAGTCIYNCRFPSMMTCMLQDIFHASVLTEWQQTVWWMYLFSTYWATISTVSISRLSGLFTVGVESRVVKWGQMVTIYSLYINSKSFRMSKYSYHIQPAYSQFPSLALLLNNFENVRVATVASDTFVMGNGAPLLQAVDNPKKSCGRVIHIYRPHRLWWTCGKAILSGFILYRVIGSSPCICRMVMLVMMIHTLSGLEAWTNQDCLSHRERCCDL